MPAPPATRWTLLVAAATLAVGTWTLRRPLRLAWMRTLPRQGADLLDVSADGTRLLMVETPSFRAFTVDDAGEHLLDAGFVVTGVIGPAGNAYVDAVDVFERRSATLVGLVSGCGSGERDGEPVLAAPVWRPDGLAMVRRTAGGVVFDGPDGCRQVPGATGAAFLGTSPVWTNGEGVWVDGEWVWTGASVRLVSAGGGVWIRSAEGLGELTADGVVGRLGNVTLGHMLDMPDGLCLADDDDGLLRAAHPTPWEAECWRTGGGARFEHAEGTLPVDVDLSYLPTSHTLRDLQTGAERPVPTTFRIDETTRRLLDGRIRTFDMHGYVELAPDGTVSESRWGAPEEELHCADCGPWDWRSSDELQ